MKKCMICLVLALCMLNMSAYAVELTEMTTEELITLSYQIDLELTKREVDIESLIYGGTFVVGEDIKPGQYIYTHGYGGVRIALFQDRESYEKYLLDPEGTSIGGEREAAEKNALFVEYPTMEKIHLDLEEGMILQLDCYNGGFGRMEKVTNSWAP